MQLIHDFQEWWRQVTWLEVIAVISGLLCVYLAVIKNIWNWPVAIISTTLYIYIFARTGFYADMLQYCYLTILNGYGWYYWSRKSSGAIEKPIILINKKQIAWSALIITAVSPLLGYTLIKFTAVLHYSPPAYPYIDSFCTVCSLVAQFFLARKVLQNWLLWGFVDVIYVVIYFIKNLQFTAFMFAVYIVIAVWGYLDWRKEYNKQVR